MSRRMIDEGYPHQVEIVVPWNGLGSKRHGAIDGWLMARGIRPARCTGETPSHARWCFADHDQAEAFAAEFDGRVYEVASRRKRRAG